MERLDELRGDVCADLCVVVTADGAVRFIWDDGLAMLSDVGRLSVRRASFVEPTADGQWTADMNLSGGGLLGPFRLRGEALAAERRWLREQVGL